jgi:U4/U6.U5 tri-snRNP-associated protein 2
MLSAAVFLSYAVLCHPAVLPIVLLCCCCTPQGRGLATHAYTHSLETAHHMFMKLDNGKVRGD